MRNAFAQNDSLIVAATFVECYEEQAPVVLCKDPVTDAGLNREHDNPYSETRGEGQNAVGIAPVIVVCNVVEAPKLS